jgi:hypothetical protein
MVGQRRPTGDVTLATEISMSYAVHHVDGAGVTQLEDLPTLDDALARVETLRNDGEASEVRVFKEIPIEVRTYYKVVAVEAGTEPPAVEPVAAAPADLAGREPADEAMLPIPPRERPARLEPPPGAMLIGPAPAHHEPLEAPEARETAPHRGIFSRG